MYSSGLELSLPASAFNPGIREAEAVASLLYISSFRPAKAIVIACLTHKSDTEYLGGSR